MLDKKYCVDITTVDDQNFQEVSSEKEKYIKKILKQSKKNISPITVEEMPENVASEFVKNGLLYNNNLDDLHLIKFFLLNFFRIHPWYRYRVSHCRFITNRFNRSSIYCYLTIFEYS